MTDHPDLHIVSDHDVTRAQHLRWVKDRANDYLEAGQPQQAWQRVISDLCKHSSTRGHAAIVLGMMLAMSQRMETTHQVREFVDGIQ